MTTLMKLVLVILVAVTLTGCRCLNTARDSGCVFCPSTRQCVKEQIRTPAEWCWGNCYAGDTQQEAIVYLPPGAMR